ncbi:MAG: Maf family protein [Actinomycetota bacterium]|nr:Maf family protein [Actinomycetota bacterium]
MTKLLLASTSPARKRLLTDAGIVFETRSPGVDEDALVDQQKPATIQDMTLLLARAKAEAVSFDGLILGCDSALLFDGEMLGKPHHPEVAIARWQKMRGKTGVLASGHWLIDGETGAATGKVTQTSVSFANLSDEQIHKYVATGEPLQVAGAFTIDGFGGAFVERIEGDYHTVVGLSLVALRELVTELGHDYQSLWR